MPDNQIRPNALERVSLRANIGAERHPQRRPQRLGRATSPATPASYENDNSFLTVNGSGTASGNLPEDINRGWYFIPAELFAELANQAGQAVHRRSHRQLAPDSAG